MASRLKPADANTAVKRTRSADQSKSTTPTVEASFEFEDTYLPPFLRLKHEEVEAKFEQIDAKQRERLEHHRRTNDPESPWTQHASTSARLRNRYMDIKPWDKTRVKLKVAEGCSDYINASPIALECSKTGQKRRYIATQGPKQASVEHFWQMVWHETDDVAVIIMLTQLQEGYREKCFQYFPDGSETPPFELKISDEFGKEHEAVLKCKESSYDELSKTTVRTLQLESQDRLKTIYHLFFLGWPDYGVPGAADRYALLELIKLSREKNAGWDKPRIVHCSAGVGRTGSFIAVEHLLAELDVGSMDSLESSNDDLIFDTVDALRQQRMTMVQSEHQYHFLYEILRDAVRAKSKERMIAAKMQGMSTGQSSPGTGEPAQKAMKFTRAMKGMWTGLRERSTSRKPEDRKKSDAPTEQRPPGELSPGTESEQSLPTAANNPPEAKTNTQEDDKNSTEVVVEHSASKTASEERQTDKEEAATANAGEAAESGSKTDAADDVEKESNAESFCDAQESIETHEEEVGGAEVKDATNMQDMGTADEEGPEEPAEKMDISEEPDMRMKSKESTAGLE